MSTTRKPNPPARRKNTWNPKVVPATRHPRSPQPNAKSAQTASARAHAGEDVLPHPPSTLPRLIDRKTLEEDMGVARSTVDVMFETLPVFRHPKQRKPYVHESDVQEMIARNTHAPRTRAVR